MISLSSKKESRYPKAIVTFSLLAMLWSVPVFSQSQSPKKLQDTIPDEVIVTGDFHNIPTFPGGAHAMYKWLSDTLIYPENVVWNGRVVVEFDISEEGDVLNPRIISKGERPIEIEKEVLRVISIMPKWIPAERNGKPIKASYALPFTFIRAEEETSD
ncbi:MAG: energy transducer TonB [Muribaculaceae bacterium]|nr:energy transducer TonB [Muribaculaceae bacterium]